MPRRPNCTRCPLHKSAKHVCLWGEGPEQAELMIIGEGPGFDDDEAGKVLVGPAGLWLDKLLKASGLAREQVYLTNVTKCRAPGSREPLATEAQACLHYLVEELATVRPKVIMLMGNVPLKLFTGKLGITTVRGRIVNPLPRMRVPDGTQIVATYHPSYLMSVQNEKHTMAYMDMLNDFKFAKRLLTPEEKNELPEHVRVKLFPNFTEEDLEGALAQLDSCVNVGIDLEWLAFPGKGIAWPWTRIDEAPSEVISLTVGGYVPNGSVVTVAIAWGKWMFANGKRLWHIFKDWLRKRKGIFHNAIADLTWMRHLGLEIKGVKADTMVLLHLLDETARLGLKQAAPLYAGVEGDWEIPPYTERPAELDIHAWNEMLVYNGNDVYNTLVLNKALITIVKQRKRDEQENISRCYGKLLLPAIPMFVDMSWNGVPMDIEELRGARNATLKRYRTAAKKFGELMDILPERAVQISCSPLQTKEFLSKNFGLDIYKSDKHSLESLVSSYPVIQLIKDIRHERKLEGTYLEPWEQMLVSQGDGRLHSMYRITSSRTGRTSASSERGGSLQLVPQHDWIRALIAAMDGYVIVACDYKNIEMRIAAWFANERNLLQLFQEDTDTHYATAAFIRAFEKTHMSVQEFWPKRQEYIKLVSKADRQAAKAVNFGFLYGMQAAKFQLYAKTTYHVDFTMEQAELARRGFFALYPDLVPWHRAAVSQLNTLGYCVNRFGRYRRVMDKATEMINTPVQATASDMTMFASTNLWHNLPDYAECLGFVHDSVLLLCKVERVDELITLVRDLMEHPPLHEVGIGSLPVPLAVEIKAGKSWGGAIEVKPGVTYGQALDEYNETKRRESELTSVR